ncbi:YlbE-like family protein [Peribacillus sp. NPDC096540]|uniref:YlbE-like family protein n=1 Tax=Peribacillus sp. NPDC096540 TaxID=3390612 RepID=UPI003CFCDC02
MRQNVYEFIQTSEDMRNYLRVQPAWYKRLMRNPHEVDLFETEAKYYFEKSIPHRVSKFSESVQVASMMLHMFQAMNTPGE